MTSARDFVDGIAWVVKPASPPTGVMPEVASAGRDTTLTSAIKLKRNFMMDSCCRCSSRGGSPVAVPSCTVEPL